MDPNNYESLDPLSDGEVLEEVAKCVRERDAHQATLDDLKEEAKTEKQAIARWDGKLLILGRARGGARPLFRLKSGGFTDEQPDTDTLGLEHQDATPQGELDLDGDPGAPEAPEAGTDEVADVEGDEAPPAELEEPGETEEAVDERDTYFEAKHDGKTYSIEPYEAAADGWFVRIGNGQPVASNPSPDECKAWVERSIGKRLKWEQLRYADDEGDEADDVPEV